ncbi:Sec-independent protein translocase protein TatB [Rhodanobacter umsongensis]|uniref:Sec-independent protein translocase protein TatB n=1 Tax=Rhodanobacter umsongensis TaxID=633153 RepID=A0ABW0JKA3_9GAMM
MIEISLGKLVLLALIALIVLGPEKLPGAARTAGALLRRVRSGWDNVRAEVERELEIEQIKRTAREAASRAEAAQNEMKEGLQQVREPIEQAAVAAMNAPGATPAAGSIDDAMGPDGPSESLQAELPLGEPAVLPRSSRKLPHDDA